jgi:A/G-specific adenine glycosylase
MKDAEGERGFVLHKRPGTGLLPDLWEFPNLEGTYTGAKVSELADTWGLGDYEIQDMGKGKHIFTHVEWRMRGVYMEVKEPEGNFVWFTAQQIREEAALPTAFRQFWEDSDV